LAEKYSFLHIGNTLEVFRSFVSEIEKKFLITVIRLKNAKAFFFRSLEKGSKFDEINRPTRILIFNF